MECAVVYVASLFIVYVNIYRYLGLCVGVGVYAQVSTWVGVYVCVSAYVCVNVNM